MIGGITIFMTMSGIDGSRVASPTAIPQRVRGTVHPARSNADDRPAPHQPSVSSPANAARVPAARAITNPVYAIGFLAQAIAQESLLFGARAPKSDHREPVELYRRTQDDTPVERGPQFSIDLKI